MLLCAAMRMHTHTLAEVKRLKMHQKGRMRDSVLMHALALTMIVKYIYISFRHFLNMV